MSYSPTLLLQDQIQAVLAQMPAIREGDVDGIHDARVATRRLRETLPLFASGWPDEVALVRRALRKMGRRLGRVRELDVMDADLARRAGRLNSALHAIAAARHALGAQRLETRRRLIESLDKLRLERQALPLRSTVGVRGLLRRRIEPSGWRALIRERIGTRATGVARAVRDAGGIYFPERAHAVRINVKKLRYIAEVAQATGFWRPAHLAHDLAKAQETLGRIHDAQVLLDATDGLLVDGGVDPHQVRYLKDDLNGDIAERHEKFLAQRPMLHAIADVANAFAGRHRLTGRRA